MNLRQLIKFIFSRDTTLKGEYQALRRLLPPDAPRVVVDVGAHDGFYGSNSYPFVVRGWRAILVEPHPVPFGQLQRRFANHKLVTCLNVACAESAGQRPLYPGLDRESPTVSTLNNDPALLALGRSQETLLVAVETLANILAAHQVPHDFGLLSVDTESMDYEVLLGMNCKLWRPRVIITEDFPAKEAAKAKHLETHGYRLAARVGGNTLWSLNPA